MTTGNHSDRRDLEREAARRISEALFQHLKVEDLVEQSLETALEVVNAQAGCILLAKPETKELVFYHAIGDRPPPVGTAFLWTEGIAGTVFKTAECIIIPDVKKDHRHFPHIDEITGFNTKDMIALPLKRWEGDPIGVLEVMNKRNGELDQTDINILTIIAAFTALAIEQAKLYQEVKLAEVARLVGDISHDVKNFLVPVLWGAALLQEELDQIYTNWSHLSADNLKASQNSCREIIQMQTTNAKRIQDRVKEIADCVKGLSSPPKFAPCKLINVVASVYDTLKLLADEKNIRLSHEGIRDLPSLQADENRLFNAFYNLVNNAIAEVLPPGGSITIFGDLQEESQLLCIQVKDTGRGMPAEIKDSLFSSSTISRKKGGTGLGTKIIKDVIDAHNGNITVESDIGRGTTFTISLPLNQSSLSTNL